MNKIAQFLLSLFLVLGIGILLYQTKLAPEKQPAASKDSPSLAAQSAASDPAHANDKLVTAFRKLLEQEGPMDLIAWNDLLEQFVRHDPHTLATLIEKLPQQCSTREFLMYRIAQKWAAVDAASAATWAKGIYFLTDRDKMVAGVCHEIAQKDPLLALQIVESCNPPLQETGIYQSLVSQLAKRDFDTALEWARGEIDQDTQGQLLQGLALVQTEKDPEAAAIFVAEQMATAPVQTQEAAALSVILQWARTDPAAARDWARTFPSAKLKQLAEQEIAATQESTAD